jgi:hypothetical protein
MASEVTRCTPEHIDSLNTLLGRYGMQIGHVAADAPIPGSFWGGSEAGLVGDRLFLRGDTPLHSALHEACHFICMDERRRRQLHTDAGGDVAEENAVCYLQGLMADRIRAYDRGRLFADMDAWGYSFRLGSARAWFEQDADDARTWLLERGIINEQQRLTGQLRHQQ